MSNTTKIANRGKLLWFNGKIVPVEDAKISLFTHALHYGTGAFEGIRSYLQDDNSGAIFRLKEHLTRLLDSLKILSCKTEFSLSQLQNGCIDVCRANGFKECYIRPLAFIGDGPLGVSVGPLPHVEMAILCWEWGKYLGDDAAAKGANLKTSTFIRPHVNSLMTKGKITGHYVSNVLARIEAMTQGFDEAILLDTEGYVAEGTGENVFIVRDNLIKTPPLGSILSGITRTTVFEIAKDQNLSLEETRFTRDELWCADEVFLTGTAAEITPVAQVDNRIIGPGVPGPITKLFHNIYHDIVRGRIHSYSKKWLTPI